MKDVAPILVQNCIACHNPKKSESKYVMTTFAQLAKGGQQGEGVTLEPGEPEDSLLVELIRPDGEPRMPYKQDPLPADKIALIERWVKEGAKYDGTARPRTGRRPAEDHAGRRSPRLPGRRADHGAGVQPRRREVAARATTRSTLWKAADGTLGRRLRGWPSGSTTSPTAPTASGWPPPAATPASSARPALDRRARRRRQAASATFSRRTDSVFAVAFSPDGKLLPPPGPTGRSGSGRSPPASSWRPIEDHADWIFDLAFSPDGKRLATASRDKTSKVFDVEKKESLVTFPGHAETVYTVAFNPDGKSSPPAAPTTRSGSGTPTRTPSRSGIRRLRRPRLPAPVHSRRQELVACGADKTVRVFERLNGLASPTLSGHNDWVYTLRRLSRRQDRRLR